MPPQRPLIVGLPALSGLAAITNQQHLDAIEKAEPGTIFGFVIYTTDGVAPDYVTNQWYTRCLWMDVLNNTLKRFNKALSSWDPVNLGSVTVTAQLTDNIVTLAKLSPAGGAALQLLRLDGAGDPEYASLSTILVSNSVPLAAIFKTGATEGALLQVAAGGVTQWTPLTTIVANVISSISSYDIQKLSGKVNGSLLNVDSSGNAAFITYASLFGTVLADNTINVTKLSLGAATELQVLGRKDNIPKFFSLPFTQVSVIDDGVDLPAPGAANTVKIHAHNLGTRPKLVVTYLKCKNTELGYAADEEVDVGALQTTRYASVVIDNSTDITVLVMNFSIAGVYTSKMPHKATGLLSTLTRTNWSLKHYCYA